MTAIQQPAYMSPSYQQKTAEAPRQSHNTQCTCVTCQNGRNVVRPANYEPPRLVSVLRKNLDEQIQDVELTMIVSGTDIQEIFSFITDDAVLAVALKEAANMGLASPSLSNYFPITPCDKDGNKLKNEQTNKVIDSSSGLLFYKRELVYRGKV